MAKKLVSVLLMGAMVFSLTGCGSKVKKYSAEEYQEIVADTLGIDEEQIHIFDMDKNSPPTPYTGTAVDLYGTDHHVYFSAIIAEDDYARVKFEEFYNRIQETLEFEPFKETFEGDYNIEYDGEVGYIVFSGGPVHTTIFGESERYKNDFYGGWYYNDNVLVGIHTIETNGSGEYTEAVVNLIDALGYPQVEDK